MSPTILGSNLADSTTQYYSKAMGDTLFPQISRKTAISFTNETHPNDCTFNTGDSKAFTRGAVQSISNKPLKFPNINRSNTTIVGNVSGSRAICHHSQSREQRQLYCRSPSCLSHLDISQNHIGKCKEETLRDLGIRVDDHSDDSPKYENNFRLPSIFTKENNKRVEKSKMMRNCFANDNGLSPGLTSERNEKLGINARGPNISHNTPLTSRDLEQRHNQVAALLLPMRTKTKKLKRRSLNHIDCEKLQNEIQRNNEADYQKALLRVKKETGDTFDAVAHENEIHNGNDDTFNALDLSSPRKVKQRLSNKENAKSERRLKPKATFD